MRIKNYNVYFFMLILIMMSVLVFVLFKPFLSAILTAAILAATFYKPYNFLVGKVKSKSLSSLLTCLLILVIIVLPTITVFGLVVKELNDVYQKSAINGNFNQGYFLNILNNVKNSAIVQSLKIENLFQPSQIEEVVKNMGVSLLAIIQKTYQNIVASVLWVFVMFFSLYYFLMDGHKLIEKIMYLSPLKDKYEEELSRKFSSMVRATLKGTIIVGTIQGILGGIMFAIVGIPSFIIWGVVMIILSIIPAIGSGLVWVPVGIIMLLSGKVASGIFVLLFGTLVISFVDNILRPKLVGNDMEMHPLLIFFSTLGGLIAFGIIGFIIGPVIMALFLVLWEIYGKEFKSQLNRYNA